MDLSGTLARIKSKAMKKIADAASKGDVKRIEVYNEIARRIEDDERTFAGLLERTSEYERALDGDAAPQSLPSSLASTKLETHAVQADSGDNKGRIRRIPNNQAVQDVSRHRQGKKMGRDWRREFADQHHLTPLRGSVYQAPLLKPFDLPKKVVIACANEQRPARWFLGVKNDQYNVVVLLCQRSNGEKLEFILPDTFLQRIWTSLSCHNGQVKFNVVANGRNFYLSVPGRDPESLNQFRGAYRPLEG